MKRAMGEGLQIDGPIDNTAFKIISTEETKLVLNDTAHDLSTRYTTHIIRLGEILVTNADILS
nr:hypothetical protein [Pseudomonadota bacterium]